jgi:hypothetical protein
MESNSVALEFLAQLDEIEYLAVVNDHGIAVGAEDRLIAAGNIQDGQPRRTQRNLVALEPRLLIRSSMGNRVHCVSQNAGRQSFTKVRKSRYATHLVLMVMPGTRLQEYGS